MPTPGRQDRAEDSERNLPGFTQLYLHLFILNCIFIDLIHI